jgi:hypothetical protein
MAINLSDSNQTDALDRAEVSDIFNQGIANATINVGSSQVEAKCSTTRLTNRKCLVIQNRGAGVIYWGATGLTSSTGMPLEKWQQIVMTVGDIAVYLIGTSATNDVRIVELA